MARIRSIKPEYWQDELLGTMPSDVQLLYIGLWTLSDDAGRFRAHPRFVHAQVFPYKPEVDVSAGLAVLERSGRIQLYEADGQSFGWVRRFGAHQRIDKPKPSVLPEPPSPDESRTNPGRVQETSATSPGRRGEERKGEEGSGTELPPPPEESATPPEPKESPRAGSVVVPTAPTTPPEEWEGLDFWRWAQERRHATGYLPERVPHPRKLSGWWSEARAVVHDVKRLKEAYYRFGEDEYWAKTDPPYPFSGFISQWERFVPKREEEDGNAT